MYLTQCIFIPLLLAITVQSLDLLHLDLRELLEMLEMMDLKKTLGGDIVVDSWVPLVKYPSLLGQFKLTYACDLICDSFDALGTSPCRWRNEWTICGSGDELDWVRACGKWGEEQAKDIFNTNTYPDGHFLLAGSQKKLPPDHSAMLVSDPIQCQHGDGKLTFNHWTSPRVRIRVCVRHPGSGKIFEWCSDGISKGAPGPSIVIIPGSIMHTFEIVIEAYNFVLDNFGKQGGIAVIDTVMYDAPAIYECAFVPHYEQAIPLNEDTCKKLNCDFDSTFCLDEEKGQDFKIGYEQIGYHHSGIRKPLKGDFAYVKGPSSASLDFSEINITRTTAFEFCFYQSTVYPKIAVILEIDEENDTTIFQSPNVSIVHAWQCQRSYLEPGYYFSLSIVISGMRNSYSMVGIDEISLIDPLNGEPCSRSFPPKMPKLKNNKENGAAASENFGNDIIDNEITKTTKNLLSNARKFDTDSSKAESLPNRLPNLSQSLVPMEIMF